jgi:hypothetical protein
MAWFKGIPLKVRVELVLALLVYMWVVWLVVEGELTAAGWVALVGALIALKDGWRLVYHHGTWKEDDPGEIYFFVLGVGAIAVFLLLKAFGIVLGVVHARHPGGAVFFSVLAAGFGLYVPFKYFRMFPPDGRDRAGDQHPE